MRQRRRGSDSYVPRPASVSVVIEGVRVVQLKIENSQARRFNRAIKNSRQYFKRDEGRDMFDEELVDILIAALHHEYGA